ncbi:hypothetical protein GGF50DRAFT_48501 [Schizophyllum commune]
MPVFTGTTPAASPGASLYDIFPLIEPELLLAIAQHTLKPTDLHKLDSRYRDKVDQGSSESAASNRGPPVKDYPSLNSLVIPLHVYFQVLGAFGATGGGSATDVFNIMQGGFQYLQHLTQLHQHYEWAGVLEYHMAFHLKRRRDMGNGDYSGWLQPDAALMSTILLHRTKQYGRDSRSGAGSSGSSKVKAGSSPSGRIPKGEQTCFLYNTGTCTTPCPDGRKHVCKRCSSPSHVERDCK